MESDTRKALEKMIARNSNWDSKWLRSYSAACPEAFRRDRSIGYVYVADGLATTTLSSERALILFCPANSHQGKSQHCHVLRGGSSERMCYQTNIEMIELLRDQIRRGIAREIPYSAAALSKMNQELRERERYEAQRKFGE